MNAAETEEIEITEIRPQPRQEMALASEADILIFGGGAGGGKTWTILLETTRHLDNPKFSSVTFRRTSPQITNPGGLWDESQALYPLFDGVPNQTKTSWKFPSGAQSVFAHLQHEKNIYDWQGAQVPLLDFDELTHFTEKQFFYLLSRNRSMCGVKPYVRASCNPDADSWVARFIAWWIDQDTGFAIEERAGVLRYMIRIGDEIKWADSKEELMPEFEAMRARLPEKARQKTKAEDFIKSVTFIPSTVFDNEKLLEANPEYLGNLMALPLVERERLLGCNWKIKLEAGKFFNRTWFEIKEAHQIPKLDVICRYWDFAATEKKLKGKKSTGNDPDYTAGVLIGYSRKEKQFFVLDVIAAQAAPAELDKLFYSCAVSDRELARKIKAKYMVRWEIEPGAAAKRESARTVRQLAGFDAKGITSRDDKFSRAKASARQAEAGNIKLLAGVWNNEFLHHVHNQPDLDHDDIMDAFAGSFNAIATEGNLAFSFG